MKKIDGTKQQSESEIIPNKNEDGTETELTDHSVEHLIWNLVFIFKKC